MKLFRKKDDRLKPGDFVAVRRYDFLDKTPENVADLYVVEHIDGDTVTCRDKSFIETASIKDCVKIPESEINRYCEMKRKKNAKAIEKPSYTPSPEIHIGDTIRSDADSYHIGEDFTVLGVNSFAVACTRPNKNSLVMFFPKDSCRVVDGAKK